MMTLFSSDSGGGGFRYKANAVHFRKVRMKKPRETTSVMAPQKLKPTMTWLCIGVRRIDTTRDLYPSAVCSIFDVGKK
jgi:hypothetical protein